MEMKRRMALNFDLNLYLLKKYYPSKQYTKAYGDIGRFLKKYEILHRQQSGYVSKDPILMTDLLSIVTQLAQKYFWLTLCAQVFDVTIVAEEYSLLKHIADSLVIDEID